MGPSAPLDFRSMLGEGEYRHAIDALYASHGHALWSTPAELFAPHYSHAVARCALAAADARAAADGTSAEARSLRVLELGGGSGAHAAAFLDYVRGARPELYARTEYVALEVSGALGDAQRARAAAAGHAAAFRVARCDVADGGRWPVGDARDGEAVVVVALEVFDNLPHDKVAYGGERESGGEALEEVVVVDEARRRDARGGAWSREGPFREARRPLADELLSRTLAQLPRDAAPRPAEKAEERWPWRLWPATASGAREFPASFVPTGAAAVFDALARAAPRHAALIVADFDELPRPPPPPRATGGGDAALAASNAPLVASRERAGGDGDRRGAFVAVDHDTYLVAPPGRADIFFASDFEALGALYSARFARARPAALKNAEFMARFADLAATTTLSGYNPLLEDFANTSFLVCAPDGAPAWLGDRGS